VSSSNPALRGPSPRRRALAGFTLIEMLVAMVILGLITSALFQLIQTLARFVAFEGQREDAQSNGRATLDIIAGDIRAVLPQGLLVARDSVLVMALPKAWGVVCTTNTATQLSAVFPSMAPDAFTVMANGGTGLMVNTSATSTPNWAPRPTLDNNRPTVTAIAAAAAGTCANTAGAVSAYTFTGTNFPISSAGKLMVLYQLVRYDAGQSDGKWWVRRSNGLSAANTFAMSPMAGPIAADSLRFSYYRDATATAVAAPGTTTATLDALSRIKVKVVTLSNSSYGGAYVRNRDSAVVLLRNRVRALTCATGAPAPC
jgi:prepilin-type N-terminal cleavage/methylation domain-containing protein